MRYGIFSDIHGNLQAFDAVVSAFKKEGIDRYYCPGDVVGYGANPYECIEAVEDLKTVCIAGNHDWAVIDKIDTTYFNPVAKAAVVWSQEHICPEGISFLKKLELVHKTKECIFVHGTLQEPDYFHYLMTLQQAVETFLLMDRDVCFIGHSHVPGVFAEKDKKISFSAVSKVTLEPRCRYIVNVGSVGQPRDGNPKAAYCVYDTEEKTISIKRVAYDIKEAQKRIIKAGLPPFLAARLEVGQ